MEAQLLFDRLLVAADDQGRLQGDPLLVKALCLPLMPGATPEAIDGWLAELAELGLIIRYVAHDEPLIQIRGWWDHQQGMRHAYPSRWPCPPEWPGDVLKGHGEGSGGPPGATGGQRPASASAGAGAITSAGARTRAPAAPEVAPTVPSPPPTDAYRAYQVLTGQRPGTTQKKWIDDLCGQHGGREAVIAAMEAEPDPHEYGFLGRVTDRLRAKQ